MSAERIDRYRGSLTPEEYRPISEALERMMGMS
jgi:hypothetical protein